MKYSGLFAVMLLLVSCGTPKQYIFELSGALTEGTSQDEGTSSLDMYQDACDSDSEVFTSVSFDAVIKPILVKEPGQPEISNDLYVNLESVRITYNARANALGNPGAPIAAVTVKDISLREMKVGANSETSFIFLSLDQKAQWQVDQGSDTGEVYQYDYTMTFNFTDQDGETLEPETFTGTFEAGHFDKCD